MKNGLECAGRALSNGLHPYRVDCRRGTETTLVAQIYHPSEPLLLIRIDLTNEEAINPFKMNATVTRLRGQLDALAAYVASVVLADGEDRCQRA
ncbi:hypothetical protein PPL19_19502 [Pseudomonas psychrotolerans L19]|uniref:hypothetical protein n=1 Tax=Pseudomonas TaxID=286 RepID=UPI00023A2171|nr:MULTISPECIES: hypothetical protein [Pseudomonas]EHK69278.1 hypothetical protein PPL19_19502 [Pseudomonas psychrotolerans L19]MBA1181190.1 hypothetical protein [Pseudomonas psychrotolerans]MBA1212722.1 hypothetical protein [Pseudomonas psychrotolerans]TCQ86452.1 hypothetical protein EC839_10897 [Pseudomonas sp. JUb52]